METHVLDTSKTTFDIGFRPKKLIFIRRGKDDSSGIASAWSVIYDEEVSTTKFWNYSGSMFRQDNISSSSTGIVEINDSGFKVVEGLVKLHYSYIAIG